MKKSCLAIIVSINAIIAAYQPLPLNSAHMNADCKEWFSREGAPSELIGVPLGDVELSGIPWRIEQSRKAGFADVIMLRGAGSPTADDSRRKIPVNRKADMIHFLQAYNPGPALRDYEKSVWDLLDPLGSVRNVPETLPPFPPTLFSYILRYDDGDTLEIRVRWNEAVYDWYPAGALLPPPFADTAWTGDGHRRWVKRSRYPQKGERSVLYAFELVNPRPEKTIESFDMVGANDNSHDWGAPALFAVTTELRDSSASIYWLSPDGDDDNPGTYDRPWASLKRVSHWNVSVLEPGVRVYLRDGIYRPTENVKISTTSTADNWSLISAWPGETPIIDGMDVHKTGDDGLLLFTRGGYCKIQRLWIQNSRISGIRSWTTNISHLIYSHNVTFKTYGPGLWTTNNSKVLGNWIIRACDMDMHSDTNTWELTTIPKEKNGVREQLELGSTDSVEAAFNWICWGDKEGIDVNGGIGKWIHHNHLHDYYRKPWINGILLNSYNPRWSNIVVEYNVVHHCGLGVAVNSEGNQPVNDILIRYNLLFKNQWRGIGIGGFGQNVRVYNNTSYGNGHHGIYVGKGLHEDTTLHISNVDVRNNLSVANQMPGISCHFDNYAEHGIQFEYNGEYPFLEKNKWGGALFHGDHAIEGDPKFEDTATYDFRLTAQSAAINAGDPSSEFSDPDGSRADLGAYVTGINPVAAVKYPEQSQGRKSLKTKDPRSEVTFYSISGRRLSKAALGKGAIPRGVYVCVEGNRARRTLILTENPGMVKQW